MDVLHSPCRGNLQRFVVLVSRKRSSGTVTNTPIPERPSGEMVASHNFQAPIFFDPCYTTSQPKILQPHVLQP
jgi:hypothetical protein